jgi:hypothetical protein
MSNRLKLAMLGLIAVAAALAVGSREGAHAQALHAHGGRAAQRTIYPDGGSDGPQ